MILYIQHCNMVKIKFNCNECNNLIEYDSGVPYPDFEAETARDSWQIEAEIIGCEDCEKEYTIEIGSSFVEASVQIYEIDEDDLVDIEEIYNYDEYEEIFQNIMENKSPSKMIFDNDINEIHALLELDDTIANFNLKQLLYRQIYIALITSMEFYLSDFIIKRVFSNKNIFKKAVKIISKNINKKYTLEEFYNTPVEKRIKNILLGETVYHNIDKVQDLFINIFDIKFDDTTELKKMIVKRHDLVHRGKIDKGEKTITIDRDIIKVLEKEINKFIDCIELQDN